MNYNTSLIIIAIIIVIALIRQAILFTIEANKKADEEKKELEKRIAEHEKKITELSETTGASRNDIIAAAYLIQKEHSIEKIAELLKFYKCDLETLAKIIDYLPN